MLLAKLQGKVSRNAMVSSVSLYYALSVLERGSSGKTADLMKSLLLNDHNAKLSELAPRLASSIVQSANPDRPAMGYFQLANAIWSTNGVTSGKPFVFSKSFVDDANKFYSAPYRSLDFMAEGASSYFNDWANEKTQGLIPEILSDDDIRRFTWVITNAAYFESSWGTSMRRIKENSRYQFHYLDGSRRSVETISTRRYKNRVFDQEDGSLALTLPFAGGKYAFVIYMPSAEEPDIQNWLTHSGIPQMPDIVDQLMNNKSTIYDLTVQLPVFSFSDELKLLSSSKATQQLGLNHLFSNQVNLSRMVDARKTSPAVQSTKVGLIKQNTKIELDENGVKAAAVTVIAGITKTNVPPQRPRRNVIVDRPFAFSIVENTTRTILFNGVLVKPGE